MDVCIVNNSSPKLGRLQFASVLAVDAVLADIVPEWCLKADNMIHAISLYMCLIFIRVGQGKIVQRDRLLYVNKW